MGCPLGSISQPQVTHKGKVGTLGIDSLVVVVVADVVVVVLVVAVVAAAAATAVVFVVVVNVLSVGNWNYRGCWHWTCSQLVKNNYS